MSPVRVGWLLIEEAPAGDLWLTPFECEALGRLRLPQRRDDFRLGRWAAKRAAAAWLALPSSAAVEVRPAPDGAPEVFVDRAPAPLVLSLTHRAGRAACAVAPEGVRLGCDLELVEPRSDLFVEDYFTPAEREIVAAAPPADRPLLANLLWSAKESALKLLRTGLRSDTRGVEVSLPPGELQKGWRPLAVISREAGEAFQGWWRREGEVVLTVVANPRSGTPENIRG